MRTRLARYLIALWSLAIFAEQAEAAPPLAEPPIVASSAEALSGLPENLPPIMYDALCVAYPEKACSWRSFAAEAMWCALGAFGFIKAAKVGRAVGKALRAGDDVGEAIVKGLGR